MGSPVERLVIEYHPDVVAEEPTTMRSCRGGGAEATGGVKETGGARVRLAAR